MDLTQVLEIGFVGLASYGAVAAVGMWKKDLTSQQKFLLLGGFAFVFGFVPADIGNFVLNHVKEAITTATVITTGNVVINKMSGK